MKRVGIWLTVLVGTSSLAYLSTGVNPVTVAIPSALIGLYFWSMSLETRGELWRVEQENDRLNQEVKQKGRKISELEDLIDDMAGGVCVMCDVEDGDYDDMNDEELKKEFIRTFCILDPDGEYPQREMGRVFERFVEDVGADISRRNMYKWMETSPDLPDYLYREDRTQSNHNVNWFGIRPKTPVERWQQDRQLRRMQNDRTKEVLGNVRGQIELGF